MTAHPIPDAALDQPLCIVGTVGSGKTYAAKSAVERLLHEGRRVIIVDPTGVWHGLRTMADGAPGFPVVIFGGEQADVPVSPEAGELLGELLANDRVTQVIVDVSEMTGGERTRFLTAMLERLYVGARVPRHLVLDEADEMASQNPLPEQLRLLGIVDKIVRRGRVRGFRPMMITQRPAVLHKNVLSQIATLVAMRLTSPQDRKAVEGWVRGSADLDEAKAVLASLPKLAVGEGWVWAPREGVLERTRFPAIATLDTSATPDIDAGPSRPRAMAPVNVAALREVLAVVPHEVPDQLTQNSSLIIGKAQAGAAAHDVPAQRDRKRTAAEAVTKREEIEAAEQGGYERGVRAAAERINGFELLFEPPGRPAATVEQMDRQPIGNLFAGRILELLGKESPPELCQHQDTPALEPHKDRPARAPAAASARSDGLNSAARKMLVVLDTNPPVRRSWQQVATLAGLKARGGHYNAGRKALVDAGLIVERDGLVAVAEPSTDARPEADDPLALAEMWRKALSGAAPKILGALVDAKRPMTRAAIAADLGMQPRGGHWNAGWKELRDNGLVVIERDVVRLSHLFSRAQAEPHMP